VKSRVLWLLAIGFLMLVSPALGSPPSASLPLDSWVYPALDKLAGLGLVESSLQGTRPYTRAEAARQLLEARDKSVIGGFPPVVYQLLRRLEGELQDQLAELGNDSGSSRSYLKPLRSLNLEYLFQDGQPSPFPGTNARQFDLDVNHFGLDQAGQHAGRFSFESEARLAGFLLLSVRPLFELQLQDDQDLDSNFELLEGKAALNLGAVEISAGRQALWWGQGRHGSLILTNNAEPLDMLRITNPVPLLLPWHLKYLGPFRFDVFWSRLESKRTIPEPYFAGLRLSFKPLPSLEIGASRTVIFGGEGRPDIDFSDFLTILGGKNLNGGADTSNQLAALDARLHLPSLRGIELYGEWGGEDEAGGFVSNHAYLAGLYLPQLESSGRLSLRLEYADLSHLADNAPPWYHHGIYRSGYTYEQKILGHHAGGAARASYAELELILPQDVTLSLGCDYQERGFDQLIRETHLQPELGLDWQVLENVTLQARYAMSRVENFAFVAGDDRTLQRIEVGGRIVW
jgi:Capsule assembly protein Wzi